eukprot:scaffold349342_cov50-Attheya_sp.AAC.1
MLLRQRSHVQVVNEFSRKTRSARRNNTSSERKASPTSINISPPLASPSPASSSLVKKTNRPGPTGVSRYIQKALIEDIEAAGGLQVAKIHHICESKSDIYGVHGTLQRKQIKNLVNTWRHTDTGSRCYNNFEAGVYVSDDEEEREEAHS